MQLMPYLETKNECKLKVFAEMSLTYKSGYKFNEDIYGTVLYRL